MTQLIVNNQKGFPKFKFDNKICKLPPIKDANLNLDFSDAFVTKQLEADVKYTNIDGISLKINQCEGRINISKSLKVKSLIIANCKNLSIAIVDCTIELIKINNSTLSSFTVENTIIQNKDVTTIILNNEMAGIYINNNSEILSLSVIGCEISVLKISDSKLSFYNQEHYARIFKVEHSVINELIFDNSKYDKEKRRDLISTYEVVDTKIDYLKIIKQSELPNFYINNSDKTDSNILIKNLIIESSEIYGKFWINGSVVNIVNIDDSYIDEFQSSHGTIIDEFNYNVNLLKRKEKYFNKLESNFLFENSFLGECQCFSNESIAVGSISIKDSKVNQGLFNNFKISSLKFSGSLYKDSIIQLDNIEVSSIKFNNFVNFGVMRFVNVRLANNNEYVQLIRSDIGKCFFSGCILGDQEKGKIHFKDSKIFESTVVGTELPWRLVGRFEKNKKTLFTFNPTKEEYAKEAPFLKQQILLLEQLRKIYDNNNDYINSTYYKSRYLDTIRHQLSNKKNRNYQEFFDLISLTLNMWTNRFGERLSRAFGFTFFGSVILYFLYVCSLGYVSVYRPFNCLTLWHIVANYIDFLSPVHKNDFLEPYDMYENVDCYMKISDCARLLDGFSRLFITYLLYQFIQAFRKYGLR